MCDGISLLDDLIGRKAYKKGRGMFDNLIGVIQKSKYDVYYIKFTDGIKGGIAFGSRQDIQLVCAKGKIKMLNIEDE